MLASPPVERCAGVVYADHDGVVLAGDLYLPAAGGGGGPFPALVAVHGGGWQGSYCWG